MDELASKLNDLLGSSDGMEKIRNLASMLGGSGSDQPAGQSGQSGQQPEARRDTPPPAPEPASDAPEGDNKDLMRTIMKMAPLISRFRQEDDSTRLLRCLRPFLSEAKQKKVDEAIKLLQFIRLIPYLKNSGLF